MAHQGLIVRSVQALENIIKIWSIPVPLVKVRKIYVCGRNSGRFRRPETNCPLSCPFQHFSEKGGRYAYLEEYGTYDLFYNAHGN